MSRNWDKFSNDEIYAIWYSYTKTEFSGYGDPLGQDRPFVRQIRITPMEIIRLVEELLKRLDAKNPDILDDNK